VFSCGHLKAKTRVVERVPGRGNSPTHRISWQPECIAVYLMINRKQRAGRTQGPGVTSKAHTYRSTVAMPVILATQLRRQRSEISRVEGQSQP
jgi:hypothetical protein